MTQIRKICHNLQPEIDSCIEYLLSNCNVKYNHTGVKGYISDVRKGAAKIDGRFTVPLWAYNKKYPEQDKKHNESFSAYFTYYVAHELAHILRHNTYGLVGSHDFRYYEIFINLCPKHLQFFELDYIKTAGEYGVGK